MRLTKEKEIKQYAATRIKKLKNPFLRSFITIKNRKRGIATAGYLNCHGAFTVEITITIMDMQPRIVKIVFLAGCICLFMHFIVYLIMCQSLF